MNFTDNEDIDVSALLRDELKYDESGIPYVDVFLLSHNDSDHITGFQKHFHTGTIDNYKFPEDEADSKKIIIHEIWGSAKFWKRKSDSNNLSDDAKAFNKEMKRRVSLYENKKEHKDKGDRVLIIGADPDGKTDNLDGIVRDIDCTFQVINQIDLCKKLSVTILGPLPQQTDEDDEDFMENNRASVIVQFRVDEGNYTNKIIIPGDAEVFVWEKLQEKWEKDDKLEFDILLTPHHCSWHSLSYDSQSKCESPQVAENAKKALSHIIEGGFIISSSKAIRNDKNDPPSYAAKKEYLSVVDPKHFLCTGEYPKENQLEPIIINLTTSGPQEKSPKSKSKISNASSASTGQAFPHGTR